jgi:hypothetical protein
VARREAKTGRPPHVILNRVVPLDCVMAKPVPLPPPGFDDLSVDEKIDYLHNSQPLSRLNDVRDRVGRQNHSVGAEACLASGIR